MTQLLSVFLNVSEIISNPFDHFFMEIGEKDHITSNDTLEKLGKNKKVIFFVNGYGENMNPDHELDGEITKYTCQ